MDCKFKLRFLQGKNVLWVLFPRITTAPYSNRWRMQGDFGNPRLVIRLILVDLQEVACISIKVFHFQIALPTITIYCGFMLNIKSGIQLMNNFCMNSKPSLSALLGICVAMLSIGGQAGAADSLRFEQDILPIFYHHCFGCHSEKQAKPKSGLRLDSAKEILVGDVIVAGKPDESELMKRVAASYQ